MSCKLEYVNRSQLPSGNTKSALLTRALFRELTDPLWPGRTEPHKRPWGESWAPGLSRTGCICKCLYVCVTPTQRPEKDPGKKKTRSTGFLDPVSHSCSTSSLEVGALETHQHMTLLNKVTLNKNPFF